MRPEASGSSSGGQGEAGSPDATERSSSPSQDDDGFSDSSSDQSGDRSKHSRWATEPWYRTKLGISVLATDIVLTIMLAVGTTGAYNSVIPVQTQSPPGIPLWVYGYSALGALGFVFTALIDKFDSETTRMLRYNMRVPAALPLGAGMFVFSDFIIGAEAKTPLVVGLVFVSGLYVNLAYKRLGNIAQRLLPKSEAGEASSH